jgi:hypothetical protein
MLIEYDISENGEFVYTTPKGVLTFKDTIQYFIKLTNDNRLKAGAIEIVYFTQITGFKFTYSEMEEITDYYQLAKSEQKIKATIFLCETDLFFAMGRMLKVLHNISNPVHIVSVVRSPEALEEEIKKINPDR